MTAGPFLLYTAGRLAAFVVVAALLWLLGFRSWILVMAALLLSMPVSYFALRRQRLALGGDVQRRVRARRELRAKLRGDEPAE